MSATIEDAVKDYEVLTVKLNNLQAFIDSAEFSLLSPEDQADVLSQRYHMEGYSSSLEMRISRNSQ